MCLSLVLGAIPILKPVLNILGFYKKEIAIQLSARDFKLVREQFCCPKTETDIKCDEKNQIVWPVRVHLRGIGTHTLIGFKKMRNDEEEFLIMEVKTDESKLIGITPNNYILKDNKENYCNPSASAPAAASAATSLEAVTASTEAICDDEKMNPNL